MTETPVIAVDTASSVPPYEQLVDQLTRLIAGGHLVPGQKLPTIRQLAADLSLAAGTVARAYDELEHAGLVRSRRPQGTFVSAKAVEKSRRKALLTGLADRFAQQAQQLGADHDEALSALRIAFGKPR
ncbi:MAG: regulatory protein GntR [Frankiales bacterium]|jgi:GntR family transcriptional regulator|nr:regulatory protein GntR [Frankiales bacterium]